MFVKVILKTEYVNETNNNNNNNNNVVFGILSALILGLLLFPV